MELKANTFIGIDIGIASVGWAVLDFQKENISGAGSWLFDKPEHDKERKPKNQTRREKRLMRRQINRKRLRMRAMATLCKTHGLIKSDTNEPFKDALVALNRNNVQPKHGTEGVTPWSLRSEALERSLTGEELAIVLGHITKHAGFQTNRKGGERNEPADDNRKALKAMERVQDNIKEYSTFGQALYRDQSLSNRKRNRANIYDRTPKRAWLRNEIDLIFQKQQQFGNVRASDSLKREFEDIAFKRLSLQDSIGLLGKCTLEPEEKRACKFSPSFERFRMVQNLVNMEYSDAYGEIKRLSAEQIGKVMAGFGATQGTSFKALRKTLKLDETCKFLGIAQGDESKDFVSKKGSGQSSLGSYRMIELLGAETLNQIGVAKVDQILEQIAFREDRGNIQKALEKLDLEPKILDTIMRAVDDNKFGFAKGAAHLSSKLCRKVLPYMMECMTFDKACEKAGYDYSAYALSPFSRLRAEFTNEDTITDRRKAIIELINDPDQHLLASPVARKTVIETVKQFAAVCYDPKGLNGKLPEKTHIELSRDVGKSAEERSAIETGQKNRRKTLDKREKEFQETFGRAPNKGELRVYEIALEQGFKCLYTGEAIDPENLFDGMSYQVDHILPWSRFGDNSFHNLTVCVSSANQAKGDRTPFEWLGKDTDAWRLFEARVEACKLKGFKKRNYLLRNAKEKEEAFRSRNLNDTRWAARVAMHAIEAFYPIEDSKKRRVLARPGGITSIVRKGWGLEKLKKDAHGERLEDDRHHALDAIVVAATTESTLQMLTKANQRAKGEAQLRHFVDIEEPWEGFRQQVVELYDTIICARPPRHRARGQGHKDTIRAFNPETGLIYIKETPEKVIQAAKKALKSSEWDRQTYIEALEMIIERPHRSRVIIESLADWAVNGCNPEHLPLGPTGDEIRSVRIIDKSKNPAVILGPKASADRGEMVRVDVFTKPTNKGKVQYYLVPIYVHQIMDKADWPEPPNRAINAHKPEHEWVIVDSSFSFLNSLFMHDWLSLTDSKGKRIEGFYKGTHRTTGNLSVTSSNTLNNVKTGIGARNLQSFQKIRIDRLGRLHAVKKETRLWHGEPYTFPDPPD